MTPQKIFDTVSTHLFTQGTQSMNRIGTCMYRGMNGLSCAVGCLIPDEMYNPSMDDSNFYIKYQLPKGTSIKTHLENGIFEFPEYFSDNLSILYRLQSVHDSDSSWSDEEVLRKRLRLVATDFDLNTDILDTLKFNDK